MTARRSRLTLAMVAALLVLLPNCNRVGANPPNTQYINLSYNGGTCQQNGSASPVEVYQNEPVVYQGGAEALTQFNVAFSTCPFASCPVNSPSGSAVNAGNPKSGTAGNTYAYSSLTINNQGCNNVQSLGVRIKPGP